MKLLFSVMNKEKIIRHTIIGLVSLFFLVGSLFISRSVIFPSREVRLGYPIHFFTLDFSGNRGGTTLSGAPDQVLERSKFNILSAWEEFGSFYLQGLISSYLIIFFVLESCVYFLKAKIIFYKSIS